MKLNVYAVAAEVKKEDIIGTASVVIDVLRMTSTAASALSNGANALKLMGDEQAARDESGKCAALLGGERKGLKLPGFTFGNSPLEYTSGLVKGKNIVLTTTNGTRAAEAAGGAKRILLCSFTNVLAVADSLRAEDSISVLCAGTHDLFSLDDCLCAGALAHYLQADEENDLALSMRLLYEAKRQDIKGCLSRAKHFRYLVSIGFERDIDYCLSENITNVVPEMRADGWFR